VNAEVIFRPADKVLSNVETLEVNYSVRGPIVSGEITEASITLRGPLMSYRDIQNRKDMSLSFEDATSEDPSLATSELKHGPELWDNWGCDGDDTVLSQLSLLFLAVNPGPWTTGQYALILVETDRPGRYIRLGFVTIHFAGWWAIHDTGEYEHLHSW
jgi:hypothetical protein